MKNKVLTAICVGFAVFFLGFVFDLTSGISQIKRNLLRSEDIIDATNLISTKVLISKEDLPVDGKWASPDFKDSDWKEVKIPSHQLVQEPEYQVGKFVYYRISVPKSAFKELRHLNNESSLALYYVHFGHMEIAINGNVFATYKPKDVVEKVILVPVVEDKNNIIAIKGRVSEGDSGIDHRDPILLGRTAELNELYRVSYKGSTVFPLIFILTKGSILFVFALIFLLLNVERSFEKFLIFGFCTVVEELIVGDYLYGPLTFNQMLYLYNVVNIGAVCAVSLFFSDLLSIAVPRKHKYLLAAGLTVVSFLVALDALFWGVFFDITGFMKFWNLVMVGAMFYFLPKMLKSEKVLFGVICISISLYLWSALFSNNVGLNMKAYGNLLLFFVVAYQTFAIFRRDQLKLREQDKRLFEQEKDVAIAKTAKLLAHDVRKPLELMQILLSRVSSGEASPEFIDVAKKDIDFSIANVSYQVSDIINFSKTSTVELHQTSFYKVLAASIRQVMAIHPEMHLKLHYEFTAHKKVLADESRLAGALVNLLTNAVEAIKEIGGKSSGVIRFSTKVKDDQFLFEIFNDGPHIPEDSLNEIFKPLFSRGKARGTGLGLSSVMKSISDQQGSVKVRNCTAGGVEFSVSLKLANSPDEIDLKDFQDSSEAYDLSTREPTSNVVKPKFRMFLLDDDAQTVHYFQFLIQQLPFDVSLSFVNDFEEGIELVHKQRFDLYVLDYDLGGGKTGLDFYKENLSFLNDEVIFHASRDLYDPSELPIKYFYKPISLHDLTRVCEQVYQSRLKILFVDDTKLIRIAWATYHGSHNLIQAASPEDALKIFEENANEIDFCVLDYNFDNSSINGEVLAQKIKELRKDMRIVIASSLEQNIPGIKSISKRDYEVRKLLL